MYENHASSEEAIEELVELVRGFGNEIADHAYPLCRSEEMLKLTDERTILVQARKRLQAIMSAAQEGIEAVEECVRHRSSIDLESFTQALNAEDVVLAKREAEGRDIRYEIELEQADRRDYGIELNLHPTVLADSPRIAEVIRERIDEAVMITGHATLVDHEVSADAHTEGNILIRMTLNTPVVDLEKRVDRIAERCLAALDEEIRAGVSFGSMMTYPK